MHHRHRRVVVALALLAVVACATWLVGHATAASGNQVHGGDVAAPAPLTASVTASGAPVGAPVGWRVQKMAEGRYVLDFARPMELSLASWEMAATVILRPLSERSWQVDFVDGHHAIDSAFSFTAAEAP